MKPKLRDDLKLQLSKVDGDDASRRSHAACKALTDLPEFREASAVMAYMPIPHEVDSLPAVLAAWRADKTVLMPKIQWEHEHMLAVVCRSLDDDMTLGRYGLREPAKGEPWPVEDIDLVIVPALAFDRKGNRLGRGGGFYDRFLSQPKMQAVTCGLAFDEQLVDELPVDDHDRPVDLVVTDKDVLRFNSQVAE